MTLTTITSLTTITTDDNPRYKRGFFTKAQSG